MKTIISVAALLSLAACGASFNREAGSVIDNGNFGNATMNNTQVMNGDQPYVQGLATRFNEEVPTTITFAFNSSVLDGEAQAVLRRQAAWIKKFPEVRFRVYGHTDLVGSAAYNKRLGQARANAAVRYLIAQGISRSRLEAVVSYGETQPLVVTQGRERRNRRTVTEVRGFVANHPLVLDGKYAQIVYRDYVASAQAQSGLSGSGLDAAGGIE